MTRWYDTDGGPVCGDCFHGCPVPPHWEICDRPGCYCESCRARMLDDRPDETLRSVARDMTAERTPTLDELRRERFGVRGLPRPGAA